MNDSARRPGLWPARGEGVLGRQGDLVLLASIADAELADRLLALLASVAAAGGDGRELINAIEDALTGPADTPAEAVQGGPAVVAFGPVGTRLALSVSGAAWAEIDTADAIPRRVPGQPGMHLRCLLSCPVSAVRAGLGTGQADDGIDRFSQLGNGTARAGGLLYIPEDAGVFRGPGTAAPAGTAGLAEHVAPVAGGAPGPGSGAAAVTPPGTDGPAPPEPRTQLVAAAATPEPGAVPAGAAQPGAVPAEDAAEPFEAVLLVGDALGEVGRQPALPLDHASPAVPPPSILGVYCKNGHFDDPQARFCAVCGISMSQKTLVPKLGSRPPLGVLAFDDGSLYQLDTDYVIGRDPALSPAVADGQAQPLCVLDDAGIVSRAHAAIRLDGWRVLVTDLGSANGTRIRHRDDEAERPAVPRVPVELRPGSHVDLGGCGFRYESHRGQ